MLRDRGFDVEFLNIPGLTDTMELIPASGWTLDDYVEWLGKKTEAYPKVILIGHSNGGRISMAFAARYQEKVERLVLEDSAGIPARGRRALKRDLFRVIAKLGGLVSKSQFLRKLLHKIARENDYQNATPEMRKTMVNLGSVDFTPIFEKIKAPTLVIWGENDTTTPLSAGMEIHKQIVGSRMTIVKGARHSPHITHTSEFVDLVERELSQT